MRSTLLLLKSMHPKFIQKLLGHASVAITLDIYPYMLNGMSGEAVNAMANHSAQFYLLRL